MSNYCCVWGRSTQTSGYGPLKWTNCQLPCITISQNVLWAIQRKGTVHIEYSCFCIGYNRLERNRAMIPNIIMNKLSHCTVCCELRWPPLCWCSSSCVPLALAHFVVTSELAVTSYKAFVISVSSSSNIFRISKAHSKQRRVLASELWHFQSGSAYLHCTLTLIYIFWIQQCDETTTNTHRQ